MSLGPRRNVYARDHALLEQYMLQCRKSANSAVVTSIPRTIYCPDDPYASTLAQCEGPPTGLQQRSCDPFNIAIGSWTLRRPGVRKHWSTCPQPWAQSSGYTYSSLRLIKGCSASMLLASKARPTGSPR